MKPYTAVRWVGVATGACVAAAAVLGTQAGVQAFGGSPGYRDIGNLTPLAQRAAISLYEEGIMNGTAPGKFSPYGQTTRAQAVKFVVNALRLPLPTNGPRTFSDVSRFSPYFGWVEAAAHDGLFAGWVQSGTFRPSAPITRVDFAVLATNALGDQGMARSMANDTSTYGYLHDLGRVPVADLGAVNAMMKEGVVPPFTANAYAPFAQMNREEFAVAIMRLYAHLHPHSGGAVASAALSAQSGTVSVGTRDPLTVAVREGGQTRTVTGSPFRLGWAIVGGPTDGASIDNSGVFEASQAGTYTVRVRVSRGGLPFPVTAHLTLTVTAAAPSQVASLSLSPADPAPHGAIDVPYDTHELVPVTVTLRDNKGTRVPQAGVQVTLTVTADRSPSSASVNGGPAPAVLTTDANGRAHATLDLTSSAGTVWDVIASTHGASAARQNYRIVSSVPAAVTVGVKDVTTGSTTTAATGNSLEITAATIDANQKPVSDHDVLEVVLAPGSTLAQGTDGAPALTFKAGRNLGPVPGTANAYYVRTNAAGQVVIDAKAASAGTLTVQAVDLSTESSVQGKAQMDVTK